MYVFDEGSGPAVLLLHGMPCPPEHLLPLAEVLAGHHRVLLPHLPGYGRSPALPGRYSFARACERIEQDIAARGIAELALVGFSGGSYRAFDLALRGNIRVTALVGLASMAGIDDELRPQYRAFADLPNDAGTRRMVASRMLSPRVSASRPEAVREVEGWLDAAPREVIHEELLAMADAEDLRPRLERLRLPTTLRVGELDAATRSPIEMSVPNCEP